MNSAVAAPAGLERLIALLREARLAVPVGVGEAVEATRLLVWHARLGEAPRPDLELLRRRLRPVLCKTAVDRERFDLVFDAWCDEIARAWGLSAPESPAAPQVEAAAAPSPPAAAPAPPPAPLPWWRRRLPWFAAAAAAAALWLATRVPEQSAPVPPPAQPASAAKPAAEMASTAAPVPAPADQTKPPIVVGSAAPPNSPAASQPARRRPAEEAVLGFTLDWRANETLRPGWLALLLALPLLGLLPLLGHPPPLPYVTRQRGTGTLMLQDWPPQKQRRQLVREFAPATSGQLQRHVRGEPALREAYARRPQVDLRRTVQATLARGGLFALHYRFARLRPTYLVLVEAAQDDELGVLWARRLAELDVRAALFRFEVPADGAEPTCVELGGLGRRLPFGALPAPWPEQRLMVVARTSALVDTDGHLRPWVQQARLSRWAQRALFSPDEPRDWKPAHVRALEASTPGAPGMVVLPLEDNALDAWSTWLVRGELPAIRLEAPQLYPRLLHAGERAYIGDSGPADLDSDPAQAQRKAQLLVTQLQAYLGQNGFYWLCACAVPPLLDSRLTLLLGEEYFRRCGANDAAVASYMARNWRLLVRLPWMRPNPAQMPQWLRLSLLARLPAAIQDELREVVRGALGRRGVAQPGAAGLTLAFDPPDAEAAAPGAGEADPRHALLVGFVRDGLDARELMLRLPGAWQSWLPQRAADRGLGRPAAVLRAGWQRLRSADAAARIAALRWLLAGILLGASGLATLAALPPATWPKPWRTLLFRVQAHDIALTMVGSAGLDARGTRIVDLLGRTGSLIDAIDRHVVGSLPLATPRYVHADASADGRLLLLSQDDGAVQVLDSTSLKPVAQPLVHGPGLRRAVPGADGQQALTVGGDIGVWNVGTATLERRYQPPGEQVLDAAWDEDGGVVLITQDSGGGLRRHVVTAAGRSAATQSLAGSATEFMGLAPDGQSWLMQQGGALRLFGLAAGLPAEGRTVLAAPVSRAAFSADGRRLLVTEGWPTVRLLRSTTDARTAVPGQRPADLPEDVEFVAGGAPVAPRSLWAVPVHTWAPAALALCLLWAIAWAGWAGRRGLPRKPAPATASGAAR